MPYVKKSGYENLMMQAGCYRANLHECDKLTSAYDSLAAEVELFKARLKTSEECRDGLVAMHEIQRRGYEIEIRIEKMNNEQVYRALRDSQWETAKWKRYFDAAMRVFGVKEYVEMPGCFNPMESIEYIAKQQEEQKDVVNRHGC
jgi:hypothetical protein